MESSQHLGAQYPERPLPAWIFSLLFHTCLIVLLALAIEEAPRGAAEEGGRTAGIVLKQSTAEGDLYEGEEKLGEEQQSNDQPSSAALMAALPSDSANTSSQSDLPQLPAIGPGSAERGGQANAGDFTDGGGRKGSPTGGGARPGFFGVEGEGNKFVYVLDRSSSMEGLPLAAAKRQLIESLGALGSVHQFQIIFFNHELQPFQIPGGTRRIAFGTDRNKQLAANFAGGITADGGTDRFAALKMAVLLQPDVIFFLTDADDPMSASELADMARLNRRAGTTICTVQFGRGPRQRENFLVDLANQTGGQYVYVDTTKL